MAKYWNVWCSTKQLFVWTSQFLYSTTTITEIPFLQSSLFRRKSTKR
jgi:hypothetical protein